MIQFNLLPDIKQEYIKAARTKRTVVSISVITILATIGILIAVILTYVGRGIHLTALNKDIETAITDLEETDDINKILTVQNQLHLLPQLHEEKPEASRLFDYIAQVTPASITISEFKIDFNDNTIKIQGVASELSSINVYADTLKFSNFALLTYSDDSFGQPTFAFSGVEEVDGPTKTVEGVEISSKLRVARAFNNVVLEDFEYDEEDGYTYEILASFDPILFHDYRDVQFSIAPITTTRSVLEKPDAIPNFAVPTNEGEEE